VRGKKDRKMRKWEDGRGNDTDEGRGTREEGRGKTEVGDQQLQIKSAKKEKIGGQSLNSELATVL
jgi:hypothetical protein